MAPVGEFHQHGKEHAEDVGGAFRHQFGVGIVVVAAHAVDDGGAQKRFHAGQKSDGQAARQHFEQQIDRNVGHFRHRQKMRHAAEFVADGVNVKAEDGDQQRGAGNADKIGRQLQFFDLHVKDSGKR